MPEELEPERVVYRLKAKEFERVNPPPTSSPEPASTDNPAGKNSVLGANLNDVQSILRENLDAANARGLNDIRPQPRRRSRRTRDYIVSTIVVNLALVACTHFNFVFALAGFALFNFGFTWMVWVVMDDY